MSFKERVEAVTGMVNELGKHIVAAFPQAAGYVASQPDEFQEQMEKAKEEVLTAPADSFTIFRHIRDGKVVNGKSIVAPSGGLTFFIRVDHKPTPILSFAISVQEQGRNFNYRLGRNVSRGRFIAGQVLTHEYDRNQSLADNILAVLKYYAENFDTLGELEEKKIQPTLVLKAYNMMADFLESLPREHPGDPK